MDDTGIRMTIPVRWGDMDGLNHVNNTKLFQYCESARIAYFDAIRLDDHKQKPTDGPGLVTAALNFRKQMHYPGTVTVTANVTAVSERSFTFTYTIRDAADNAAVADGTSVAVWVDYEKSKAMRLPDALVDTMAVIENNPELRRRGKSEAQSE